jgi:hypothetical protein
MFFDGLVRPLKERSGEIRQADIVIVVEARGRFGCRILTAFGQSHLSSGSYTTTSAHMLLDQNPIPFL